MHGACPRSAASLVRKPCSILLAFAATVFGLTTHTRAQYLPTHHVRDVVRDNVALPVGRMPANQVMTLNIVLPLRDEVNEIFS